MSHTDFDAIVVGSGITGGWAAKELCERGLKVLVLERGRMVEHGRDYPTEHLPPWKIPSRNLADRPLYDSDYPIQQRARGFDFTTLHFWNNDRLNPYQQAPGKPYNWFRADVVGGKSLMWGRHSYRWSDLDFEANRRDGHGCDWPIRYRDIRDWYSHVERFIGVSGEPLGLDHLPDGEFQPPMELNVVEKAFKRTVETTYPGRHVTIGRVANLTRPIGDRAACHYCGPCQRGCSAGAYFSTQSSTLPAARRTGNLTLRPDSVVESLEYDEKSGRVVAVRVVDANTRARQRFTARLVFLCASAYASLQVLLNSTSRSFPQGIANRSGTLGRYVMDHVHGQGAVAVMPGFDAKYYFGNRPNTFYLPRFRNLGRPNLDRQEPGVDFLRGYGYQGMAFPMEWNTTWASTPGFGADFKRALRKPGHWLMFMIGFAECLPYEDNRVVLARETDRFGIPQLRFELTYRDNEARAGHDMWAQAVEMMKAAGGVDVQPLDKPFTPGTSIHEFGGARMGADPHASVLNAHNQAHDVPNLFVTDGACMSSTSCVNPSLTYMALTARAAEYAAAQLKAGTLGARPPA
ncbi:MAG: GMC family oxidoreductase [Steroidobacteraceae bacterium]